MLERFTMPTLSETLEAKKLAASTEVDIPLDEFLGTDEVLTEEGEAPPEAEPYAITTVDAANLTLPNNGINSLQYLKRDTTMEADRDPSAAQKVFMTPTYAPVNNTYTAVDNSRKGYQFQCNIIRPDSFGVYTPANAEEDAFLADLAAAGILTAAIAALPT